MSQPASTQKAPKPRGSQVKTLRAEVKRLQKKLEEGRHSPVRKRLSDTRRSITHKFSICGHEGYLTAGLYDDGTPGELFIKMAKQGSTVSGLVDTIAVLTSLALQYGVPVERLTEKFQHTRFEPSGHTTNPEIRTSSSISDYIFRWLALQFSNASGDHQAEPCDGDQRPAREETGDQ